MTFFLLNLYPTLKRDFPHASLFNLLIINSNAKENSMVNSIELNRIAREEIEEIKRQFCIELGINPDQPPFSVSVKQASAVTHVKEATLATWRSSNRYGLKYTKMGRHVRYRMNDLAEFAIKRTRG